MYSLVVERMFFTTFRFYMFYFNISTYSEMFSGRWDSS